MCKTLDLKVEDTSYSDIMQRLVKRYLFKMERAKDEKESGKKNIKAECLINPLFMNYIFSQMRSVLEYIDHRGL